MGTIEEESCPKTGVNKEIGNNRGRIVPKIKVPVKVKEIGHKGEIVSGN